MHQINHPRFDLVFLSHELFLLKLKTNFFTVSAGASKSMIIESNEAHLISARCWCFVYTRMLPQMVNTHNNSIKYDQVCCIIKLGAYHQLKRYRTICWLPNISVILLIPYLIYCLNQAFSNYLVSRCIGFIS